MQERVHARESEIRQKYGHTLYAKRTLIIIKFLMENCKINISSYAFTIVIRRKFTCYKYGCTTIFNIFVYILQSDKRLK